MAREAAILACNQKTILTGAEFIEEERTVDNKPAFLLNISAGKQGHLLDNEKTQTLLETQMGGLCSINFRISYLNHNHL